MKILGISAYYHDSAVALIDQGRPIAAAQEERFTRKKHDSRFPSKALEYCLSHIAGSDELDAVVFYDKPFRKFDRLLQTHLAEAPRGLQLFDASIPIWLRQKLFQGHEVSSRVKDLAGASWTGELLFAEHHQSHAASAFFPSPFESAAVLTMDGVGEWATTSMAIGEGNSLRPLKELRFPHSVGLLYSAVTAYLGFRVNSGEYKVMGLAPYGSPTFRDRILDQMLDLKEDGSFHLNQEFFGYCTGLSMFSDAFDRLFDGKPRSAESAITQREMDIAASVQAVVEQIVDRIARHLAAETGLRKLCLAGGVALNCVANGKLLTSGVFDDIWIQPAAGDAGGALGAALAAYYGHFGNVRSVDPATDSMRGAYLGPDFAADTKERLERAGARFTAEAKTDLLDKVCKAMVDGMAVGWFNGRMEFGPRALGARSIIADPRQPDMQRKLNLKIKFRESFRPFAPAVLAEHVSDWFELEGASPYMLLVAPIAASRRLDVDGSATGFAKLPLVRSTIPAVTHVDYTARIQTVHEDTNPDFSHLLARFYELTGCPVLVNTSFNVRGEPIVCTPEDAFRCFMGTDLDVLVVNDCLLYKSEQDSKLAVSYKERFALD